MLQPNSGKRDRLLCFALALLAMLRCVFLFIPAPSMWGINPFAFLPVEWGLALSALSLGFVVWAMLDKGEPEKETQPKFNLFSLKARIAVPLGAGVLFFVCAIPFALLGDGGLFLGDLYRYVLLGQAVPLYREPLTMLLNSRVYSLIYPLQLTKDIDVAYHVTGAIFGMIYIATALKIASSLRASYSVRVLSFVLFATGGGVLLFFGYVENYAPQYACDLVYVALVIHMFRSKGSPVWPGVVLLLCCLFHLQNILLIPSFAVALGMRSAIRNGTGDQFGARVYRWTAMAAPLLLLVYAYFQWRPIARLEIGNNPFIPFLPVGGTRYTLFSAMHVVDVLNEHLLLAPLAIALGAVMILLMRKNIRWTAPEMVSVVIAGISLEAFLIGGNLLNGLGRDWDVVSALGIMITFIAVLVMEQVCQVAPLRRRVAIAACVVAGAGSISWIAVNVDVDTSIARYTALVEYHRSAVLPSVTRYGYESLRKIYFQRRDWKNEIAIDAIMLEILPWHFDFDRMLAIGRDHASDSAYHAGALVAHLLDQLVRSESDERIRSEVGGDEGTVRIAHPGSYPGSLGDLIIDGALDMQIAYHQWSAENTMTFADTLIVLHPVLPYGYELKGIMKFLAADTVAAALLFRQSAALDDHRANPLVKLALCYNNLATRDSLRFIAVRALQRDMGNIQATDILYASLNGVVLSKNDIADMTLLEHSARTLLQRTKEREYSKEQIQNANIILKNVQPTIKQLRESK